MNPNGNNTYKDEMELKRCKVSFNLISLQVVLLNFTIAAKKVPQWRCVTCVCVVALLLHSDSFIQFKNFCYHFYLNTHLCQIKTLKYPKRIFVIQSVISHTFS